MAFLAKIASRIPDRLVEKLASASCAIEFKPHKVCAVDGSHAKAHGKRMQWTQRHAVAADVEAHWLVHAMPVWRKLLHVNGVAQALVVDPLHCDAAYWLVDVPAIGLDRVADDSTQPARLQIKGRFLQFACDDKLQNA